MKLVTWIGSTRKGSYNAALARALPDLAPPGLEIGLLPAVDALPFYNADLQAQGFPPEVEALGHAIKSADGLVIVTPEYNYSVPGGLKNAIDWVSRLPSKPFAGKPVLIQSASQGVLGGARAQYHLRQILVFLDAIPFNVPEVMVAAVQTKIDAEGRLHDQATRDFVAKQLALFEAFAKKVSV
jgi:chromate reductase